MRVEMRWHRQDGVLLPVALWSPGPGYRMISSGVGFRGTGTASDAICAAAPVAGEPEDFAGPRSLWGARIARAVHAAVYAGAVRYRARAGPA